MLLFPIRKIITTLTKNNYRTVVMWFLYNYPLSTFLKFWQKQRIFVQSSTAKWILRNADKILFEIQLSNMGPPLSPPPSMAGPLLCKKLVYFLFEKYLIIAQVSLCVWASRFNIKYDPGFQSKLPRVWPIWIYYASTFIIIISCQN